MVHSGEGNRDHTRTTGKWPDGAPVGRGHGQPYLRPIYAQLIRKKLKTVEAWPNEGVRFSIAHASPVAPALPRQPAAPALPCRTYAAASPARLSATDRCEHESVTHVCVTQ